MTKMLLKNYSLKKSGIFKKAALPTVVLVIAAFCSLQVIAQKTIPVKPPMKRCGTMEALEQEMLTNPELRARIEQNERDYQAWLSQNQGNANRPSSPATPLGGPVEIPVVVHVVLPNPWMITDDAVEYFINRLNLDFSGLNPDSTNGVPFYSVRGHSLLRFVLAKRDPFGNFTTGVIRKIGTTEIVGTNNQPIKSDITATGGSKGWDISKYYNLYVGDGGAAGLLGISPGIGPGSAVLGSGAQDGVCVDYRAFGPNCFSFDEYKMSRTAVHEIGHNFGLYHTFQGGCAGPDFAQISTAGCSLPANLIGNAFDDTPPINGPTGGCPSGNVSNGCSPVAAKMYQNYMDYTDDACYSMFTNHQADRMNYVLEHCRSAGYLTTLGGQYPDNTSALDAAVNSVVSPGGADFDNTTCTGVVYPAQTCPGSFVPRLRIANAGTTTLTSITVSTSINGLQTITETFTVNIRPGKSAILTLSSQNAVPGPNALWFILSSPNGGIDGNAANDTLKNNFNIAPALPLPYVENFTSATFPPANGSAVINPDADETWKRTTLAGKPGQSMRVYCFDYPTPGERDIFRTSSISTTPYDSIRISFYVAHRQYPGSNDSLKIIYSADCGANWFPTGYAKGSVTLSTVTGTTDQDFVPTTNQWRKESVVIGGFCGKNIKNVQIGFECYNDYGNNIYVDSINIVGYTSVASDARLESINQPFAALCAAGSVTPQVSFSNAGLDTLRALTIHYTIDGGDTLTTRWTGAVGKCDFGTASLPASNVLIGNHLITVFITRPNDTTDLKPGDDTLSKQFTAYPTVSTPVVEGFEDLVFPGSNWGVQNVNGANWGIQNPNGGTTWERTTTSAKTGTASMWINNPNLANINGALDYFVSPVIKNSASFDSLYVSFDVSYRAGPQYPGSTVFPLDTLEVLATTDCGISFTSVWKKWGNELQTVNDPNYSTTRPFVPVRGEEWIANKVDLKQFIGSSDFQLYFAAKSNRQNNIWIDNINIASVKLPQRLKDQGYLIYPNPFNSTFLIHHSSVEAPVDLQGVLVYNSAGQLVWSKEYNGNASRQITVDLKNSANGVYILKMIYTNKTVVERIVKH